MKKSILYFNKALKDSFKITCKFSFHDLWIWAPQLHLWHRSISHWCSCQGWLVRRSEHLHTHILRWIQKSRIRSILRPLPGLSGSSWWGRRAGGEQLRSWAKVEDPFLQQQSSRRSSKKYGLSDSTLDLLEKSKENVYFIALCSAVTGESLDLEKRVWLLLKSLEILRNCDF